MKRSISWIAPLLILLGGLSLSLYDSEPEESISALIPAREALLATNGKQEPAILPLATLARQPIVTETPVRAVKKKTRSSKTTNSSVGAELPKAEVHGRMILNGAPAAGVHLWLQQTSRTIPGTQLKGARFRTSRKVPASVVTRADGRYAYGPLPIGRYSIEAKYPMESRQKKMMRKFVDKTREPLSGARHEKNIRAIRFEIRDSNDLDLGDQSLQDESTYQRFANLRFIDAKVRMQCKQPGLRVQVTVEDWNVVQDVGTTDSRGELSFEWIHSAPIQLKLYDTYDKLIAESEPQIALNPTGETLIILPLQVGSLNIQLPDSFQLLPHQAVQYSWRQSSSTDLYARVETVYGSQPNRVGPGVKTQMNSLAINALARGHYKVQANCIFRHDDGTWLPYGAVMKGNVFVEANQDTLCSLR